MAATFKPLLELELPFDDTASPQHSHHSAGTFSGSPLHQRIKTNGSLFRSHSAEDGRLAFIANGGDDDLEDDASPQLKDVENLLNGYEESPNEEENASPPVLLSECPEFQAYLAPSGAQLEGDDEDDSMPNEDDEIIFGFTSRSGEERHGTHNDDEGAMWELIEAEAEALCKAEEESKARCLDNQPTSPNHASPRQQDAYQTLTRVSLNAFAFSVSILYPIAYILNRSVDKHHQQHKPFIVMLTRNVYSPS